MAARSSVMSSSQDGYIPVSCQGTKTVSFLSEDISKAVRAVVPDYESAQEKEAPVLERRTPFSELMSNADLEVYQLSFHQVDLSLTHSETLVLCQSYALLDPSFVPKLLQVDMGSRFLVLTGVGRVMGMFLAFSPGQIPPVVYQYMVSLENLTQMVAKALGFELVLLNKIVVNCQSRTRPLFSAEGHEQLLRRLMPSGCHNRAYYGKSIYGTIGEFFQRYEGKWSILFSLMPCPFIFILLFVLLVILVVPFI